MLSEDIAAIHQSPCPERTWSCDDESLQAVTNLGSGRNEIRKIGPYRLEERLGAGGMGAVYRAFDERLERPVALKQILPEAAEKPQARKRFRREARAAARLNHPGIVKVYDFLEGEDCDWIVMELVEGETLAHLLTAGALPWERAVALAVELADALAAAHAEGIVHRDLKARNVIVLPEHQASVGRTWTGRVKILDFGLAKQVLYTEGKSTPISVEGQLVGTPQAMSPEQAMGRKVDRRSDLFSLGSLLYEMVTGAAPFRDSNPLETLARVCRHHPRPARELAAGTPRALSELVERLLEKNPLLRPQTAEEVVLSLQSLACSTTDGRIVDRSAPASASETAATTEPLTLPHEEDQHRPVSERRQVTVMCCELITSGRSFESFDPEALSGVMDRFEVLAREAVERFEGYVAHALGHRLVVYFGYPRAHEDDARRAVNAAQELVARCSDLEDRSRRQEQRELAVRIGIHTGSAVVLGNATRQEQLALGQTLDLATGLRKLGKPKDVLVSSATQRLIAGLYGEELLEPTQLEGLSEPVKVFRLYRMQDRSSEWQLAGKLTPLVAREHELELLTDLFQRVRDGHGQVVLLSGEAGIGKSRLVHTLRERLVDTEPNWLTVNGSPYARASPLYPVIEFLRRYFRISPDQAPEDQLRRLEIGLTRHGLATDRDVSLFASLLSLPFEQLYAPLGLTPQKQREKTLQALLDLFTGMARHKTLVFLVEDLHWLDPSTLELLEQLIDRVDTLPLLLLLTFRLEFEGLSRNYPYITQINLTRLSGLEAADLIGQVTGERVLPREVEDQIVAKTDGVPLFIEELSKNILESGFLIEKEGRYVLSAPLEDLAIPATLRDSLTARLDRLGPAKKIAQLASVIGREFTHEILAAISPLPDSELEQALDRLVESDLVHRKGLSRRRRYLFKHALIQDAAYDSLLLRQRQQHHRQIAQTLENSFPRLTENRPDLLAHHFTEANLIEPALIYWQTAGQRAVERSANAEAIKHLERGLTLLQYQDATPQRDQTELDFYSILGPVMIVNRGFGASEVEQIYGRAYELCDSIGDSPQLGWILTGLIQFADTRADLKKARALVKKLFDYANSRSDKALVVKALFFSGMVSKHMGEFDAARRDLEESLALNTVGEAGERYMDASSAVQALSSLGFSLWIMGYPDQALQRMDECVAAAQQSPASSRPALLGWALSWRNIVLAGRLDRDEVRKCAKEAISICEEVGIPVWLYQAKILLGSALAASGAEGMDEKGEDHGAMELMRRNFTLFCETGARIWRGYLASHLIEASIRYGQAENDLLQEMLTAAESTGERFWEAELRRLRGEMALITDIGNPLRAEERAERYFNGALDLARHQGAKSLELRVALSLSRLWLRQGNQEKPRNLLSEIYGRFTEGFDTGDLKQARHIIENS